MSIADMHISQVRRELISRGVRTARLDADEMRRTLQDLADSGEFVPEQGDQGKPEQDTMPEQGAMPEQDAQGEPEQDDQDDQDDDQDAPAVPAPSNPVEEMIDDRVKLHMDVHRATDPHGEGGTIDQDAIEAAVKAHAYQQVDVNVTMPSGETVKVEGQHKQFAELLHWLTLREHAYIVGPAGWGKSHAAIEAAKVLGLEYYSTGAVL